jgi:methionyl-tRNA formyltransferase
MSKPLRIVFAGTPDFAAQTLASLINSQHEVIAVYSQPDRRSGRGKKITQSPVKKLALEQNIDIYQPLNFKQSLDVEQLAALKADIMVIVAYGLILPQSVLDTPPLGCINVHASLLPRWRGAAPIERAILAGDSVSGVTIMQMDKGLDTGDMLNTVTVNITDSMNSEELHDQLIDVGAIALSKTLDEISVGEHTAIIQDNSQACYAEKLNKSEGDIDWSMQACEIARKVRGLCPRPVAFSQLDEQVIRIWAAAENIDTNGNSDQLPHGSIISANKNGILVACKGNSQLLIQSIQLPNGKQHNVQDIIHSKKEMFAAGKCFQSNALSTKAANSQ